jgi:citrate lyase gamma subunit
MQSLTNQRFKDEIEKNIYKRIKKIAIRRIKIKIKYKLKGNKKTFD